MYVYVYICMYVSIFYFGCALLGLTRTHSVWGTFSIYDEHLTY